jgi:hypothetical protein
VETRTDHAADNVKLLEWTLPLQTLFGIPSVQLEVEWEGSIADRDHLCLNQWLRQHGKSINHLTVQVYISEDRLNLREFAEAAAGCRSINLSISQPTYFSDDEEEAIDLAELTPLVSSLECLTCDPDYFGILRGLSALSSLQHLTSLSLLNADLVDEEPWDHLSQLTSLRQLSLEMRVTGDPSPLSALTRLSSLCLESKGPRHDHAVDRFGFSSLQPLSTLQQLQTLELHSYACTATSLQGLAGLGSLKGFELLLDIAGGLRSLEGIGSGVAKLSIVGASDLVSLAGIEGCSKMKSLGLHWCGVSLLQPLVALSSLERLSVSHCDVTSLEGLCGRSLQSLSLDCCKSLTLLSGIEQLTALKRLEVKRSNVTSLQPLSQLGEGIEYLIVEWCRKVQEVVLELPHVQPTADVSISGSGVREVVLAGGVIRAMC